MLFALLETALAHHRQHCSPLFLHRGYAQQQWLQKHRLH